MNITNDFTKQYTLNLTEEEILKADSCDKATLENICQEIQKAATWIRDRKKIATKQLLEAAR